MLTISTLEHREKGTGLSNPYFVSRWNSSRGVCLQPPSHSAEELDSNHSTSTVNSTSLEKHPYITFAFVSLSVNETGMHFAIVQRGTATHLDNENKAVCQWKRHAHSSRFYFEWIFDATTQPQPHSQMVSHVFPYSENKWWSSSHVILKMSCQIKCHNRQIIIKNPQNLSPPHFHFSNFNYHLRSQRADF